MSNQSSKSNLIIVIFIILAAALLIQFGTVQTVVAQSGCVDPFTGAQCTDTPPSCGLPGLPPCNNPPANTATAVIIYPTRPPIPTTTATPMSATSPPLPPPLPPSPHSHPGLLPLPLLQPSHPLSHLSLSPPQSQHPSRGLSRRWC